MLSVFDLYSVGIGPSSSHTVGPMRAAAMFVRTLGETGVLGEVGRVRVELFGSLGATGHGHGSLPAVLLGLAGAEPETVDTDQAPARVQRMLDQGRLPLGGEQPIEIAADDVVLHRRKTLPLHANGMTFAALAADGTRVLERTYYSVGGGFVVTDDGTGALQVTAEQVSVPYPFSTGTQLLAHCEREGLSISEVMLANESVRRSPGEIRARLVEIWSVMQECVRNGCRHTGTLPGALHVRRRAAALAARLDDPDAAATVEPLDWVQLWALAVNEENASGGRIVTAPTNGAAGIIPAVLHYYLRFVPGADDEGVVRFLLAAGAVGIIVRENASISGAEVGCQGEVGSACSMAAAGLTEVRGGSPAQVENAAEIGIEHNLGLTCDPIGGLVQIPCIERNAVASVKAIAASRMAMYGDGAHYVSLDKAVKTMRDTGRDMSIKYKETSRGGLAVNVVEC